jgi:hypothetical protein
MEKSKKRRYQICFRGEYDTAFPVDWDKLGEKVFDNILPEYIYNVFSLNKEGHVGIKSVVYFRPVSKFEEHVVPIKVDNNIIFGV